MHFLRYWQGEFVYQSKAFFTGDHFLYSHDLNVLFRDGIVGRSLMLVTLRVKRINRHLQIILTKVNFKKWKKFEEGIFKNWKFYPEALNLFNYGLDLHLFMNFFTKKIPLRTTWLTLFSCLIYGRKYFSTRNNKFHLTYIKSNSDGNFSHSELCFAVLCLDYMEKY